MNVLYAKLYSCIHALISQPNTADIRGFKCMEINQHGDIDIFDINNLEWFLNPINPIETICKILSINSIISTSTLGFARTLPFVCWICVSPLIPFEGWSFSTVATHPVWDGKHPHALNESIKKRWNKWARIALKYWKSTTGFGTQPPSTDISSLSRHSHLVDLEQLTSQQIGEITVHWQGPSRPGESWQKFSLGWDVEIE